MKKLKIDSKAYHEDETGYPDAPEIQAVPSNGVIEITGNAFGYYDICEFHFQPLADWLKEYTETPNRLITLKFKINHINHNYSKYLAKLLNKLIIYKNNKNGKVNIDWYYKDEDTLTDGKDFQQEVDLEFNFISY